MLFSKNKYSKNKYSMDMETANETLQKVFAACDTPPNTIPFDKIILRQKAHTKIFFIGKWICLLCLLLILLAPLVFFNSSSGFSHTANEMTNMKILKHYIKDDKFIIYVSGSDLHLNYSYASTSDGNIFLPDYYNNETGELIFSYPYKPLNIFISCNEDEFLHIILTPKK